MRSSTSCSPPDVVRPAPPRLLLLLKVIAEKLHRGVGMMDAPLCLLLQLQMEQQADRQTGPGFHLECLGLSFRWTMIPILYRSLPSPASLLIIMLI